MGKLLSKEQTNRDTESNYDFHIARHPVDPPNNASEFTLLINGYLKRVIDNHYTIIPNDIITIIEEFYPYIFILEEKAIFQYQMITQAGYSLSSSYAWSADTERRKVDNCIKFLGEQLNKHFPDLSKTDILKLIANFVYYHYQALDRAAIGFYLAKTQKVFVEYMKLLNFKGQSIDKALGNYLKGFALTGQQREIDSFLIQFSDAYCKHNKNEYHDLVADDVYFLSYAIILLNATTARHNSRNSNKITKAEWIRRNDFDNNLQSIAAKRMVNQLYDNILLNRIELER